MISWFDDPKSKTEISPREVTIWQEKGGFTYIAFILWNIKETALLCLFKSAKHPAGSIILLIKRPHVQHLPVAMSGRSLSCLACRCLCSVFITLAKIKSGNILNRMTQNQKNKYYVFMLFIPSISHI